MSPSFFPHSSLSSLSPQENNDETEADGGILAEGEVCGENNGENIPVSPPGKLPDNVPAAFVALWYVSANAENAPLQLGGITGVNTSLICPNDVSQGGWE